jgi:excisionase family DNA binding protein
VDTVTELGRALLDELGSDPAALTELRRLIGHTTVIYTPATLAAELGVTARAIRAAIERGDLEARRSGRGYVIGAEAVAEWARPAGTRRGARRSSRPRTMRDALRLTAVYRDE